MQEEIVHRFVAAALVRRGDQILLVRQQGDDDVAPYWSIPGGVVEAGEAVTAAAARELREESGLIADAAGRLAYVTWIEHAPALRTTALVYEIPAWTGEIALADPSGLVHDAAFFPVADALARLQALPYRSMREPLLAYLRGHNLPGSAWVYGDKDDPWVVSPAEAARWQSAQVLSDVGSERGRAAVYALETSALFETLAAFTPTLIGTIPLGVETAHSDLDVACFAPNLADFAQTVRTYAAMPTFFLKEKRVRGVPCVIAGFRCADVDVQIFAQPQPVLVQYGYRHLVVEERLLACAGACRGAGDSAAQSIWGEDGTCLCPTCWSERGCVRSAVVAFVC